MAEVVTRNIAGCSVYGVQQVQYTVDGSERYDFGRTLAAISLSRAAAIEEQSVALSWLLKLSMKKVEELGNAMAEISRTLSALDPEDVTMTTKITFPESAMAILRKYDVPTNGSTRGDLTMIQSKLKYAIDKEQNELQQDNISVQNMVSKRDEAYEQASSLMKKVYDDMGEQINKIGG